MNRTVRTILQTGIMLALIVAVVLFVFQGYRRNQAREEALQDWLDELAVKIEPYQEEIDVLEEEIEEETVAYLTENDHGRAISAYFVYTPEDIEYTEKDAVLVFDCTWEDAMLTALAESGRELVMLYNDYDRDKIEYVRDMTGVVNVILPENKQGRDDVELLEELDFEVIFTSQKVAETGLYEDDIVRMPYIYLNSYTYDIAKYLDSTIENQDVLLIIYDVDLDAFGLSSYLDTVHEYEDEGTLVQSTIEQQTDYIRNQETYEAERQAAFDALIAEKQARIDELNELIAEAFE